MATVRTLPTTPQRIMANEANAPAVRRRPRFKLVGVAVRFGDDVTPDDRERIVAVVCEAAGQALRASDVVYRTGSAELALLLREADEAGAQTAIARVQARTARLLAERAVVAPPLLRVGVQLAAALNVRRASVPA